MKIIVTGSKGQLAKEIIDIVQVGKSEIGSISGEYKDCDIIGTDIEELDITDERKVNDFILKEKPDIVINCAAMTDVDACESKTELAMKINAIGPGVLSRACREVGAKIIHISTDYVFPGKAKKPYCEWDICNPESIYGKSKYLGEVYLKEQNPNYFIVRTAWLYGRYGNNFVKTMIKLGKEKKQVNVVFDQVGNPTNANDLAYHILKLAQTSRYGIYHCTGEGQCSWYDFAKEIMRLADLSCEVKPCTSAEFPRPAKRPSFSSLDNLMLRSTIGNEMRHWKEALKSFITNKKCEGSI